MIIFWGWGKKTAETHLNGQQRVIIVYHYFHVMWLFQAAWGASYLQAAWTEQGWATREITKEYAAALCGGNPPQIPMWRQWSLAGAGAVAVLVFAFGLVFANLSN